MPGEQQIAQFVGVGHAPGYDFQIRQQQGVAIGILDQRAAGDALVLQRRLQLFRPSAAGKDAHIGLFGKCGKCGIFHFRCDHHFDELASQNRLRGGNIQRLIEGDDATERGHRIGGVGGVVGFQHGRAECHAARIGVLDDDARGSLLERFHAFQRGVGVGDVVVGEFLAGEHVRSGDATGRSVAFKVECGVLVRILAVAQHRFALERQVQGRRKLLNPVGLTARAQPVGDRAVVARGVRIGLGGETAALIERGAVVRVQSLDQFRVVGWINHGGDVFMVLGGGAQHRRAADVDVFDRLGHRAVGCGGDLFKRIQIHHQQIDAVDAVLRHRRIVDAAPAEQTAVDFWVQGLDATVHDLGKAGDIADFAHADAGFAQRARGAAGGDQGNAERVQTACQIDQAGLVGHAQQRASNRYEGGIEHGISRQHRRAIIAAAASTQTVRGHFFAQGRAIDAECHRRLALVAATPGQHFAQQRRFHFAQYQLVEAIGHLRIQIGEIAAHRARNAFAQRRLQHRLGRGIGVQNGDGIHSGEQPFRCADFLGGSRYSTRQQ